MKLSSKKGFSLLEVMVALVIFFIGFFALLNLQITAIHVNESNKKSSIARETLAREVEAVKTIGYQGLKTDQALINNMGYQADLTGLPSQYQFPGIDPNCNSPFTYCVYRGITIDKTNSANYDYTVKLSVDIDYLSNPILDQGVMSIYWLSRNGDLKTSNVTFFVEVKP